MLYYEGHVSAITRLHQPPWGDRKMGTAISCKKKGSQVTWLIHMVGIYKHQVAFLCGNIAIYAVHIIFTCSQSV